MLVVAAFFGGMAVGRKHQERQVQALRTATDEVIGKLLKSHTAAMSAAEKRIADLQEAEQNRGPAEIAQRMPTFRRRTERMPTMRDEPGQDALVP